VKQRIVVEDDSAVQSDDHAVNVGRESRSLFVKGGIPRRQQ
jgi:hypothetical protein